MDNTLKTIMKKHHVYDTTRFYNTVLSAIHGARFPHTISPDPLRFKAIKSLADHNENVEITREINDWLKSFHPTPEFFYNFYSLITHPRENRLLGQVFTPKNICEFILDALPQFAIRNVIDICCGIGTFLREVKLRNMSIFGVERDRRIYLLAKLYTDSEDIIYGDGLYTPCMVSYDLVFTNPPFNTSPNIEYDFIYHSLLLMKNDGYGVFILPANVACGKYFAKHRALLEEKCDIYATVDLPRHIYSMGELWSRIFFVRNKSEKSVSTIHFDLRVKVSEALPKLHEVALEIRDHFLNPTSTPPTDHRSPLHIKNTLGHLIDEGVVTAVNAKVVNISELERGGDVPIITGGLPTNRTTNVSNFGGDVITISKSGGSTFNSGAGYVSYHQKPIFVSDCIVLWSNREDVLSTECLYERLKGNQDELFRLRHGTTIPHIYISDIRGVKIY